MLIEDSQIQECPQGQPQLTQTPSQPLQVYYTAKTLTTPYATANNASLLTGVKSAAPVIQYEVVQPLGTLKPIDKPQPWTPIRSFLLERELSSHPDKIFVRQLIM